MSQRLERLRARLLEKGYDGILVSQAENRRYLSGFAGSAGYLVITQKEAVLCTDFRYTEQAGLQAPEFNVQQIAGDYSAWLTPLVTDLQAHRLAFDAQHITVKSHTALQKAFVDTQVELLPDSETVEVLRAIKEPEEIAAVERAQALTDAAFIYVSNERMQPGMTENEVAWELERFIREHGGEGLAFDTIIAAGANSARPHHRAGETRIKAGEPIVMDFGAKVDGYCADMTRTVCLGEQDDEFRRCIIWCWARKSPQKRLLRPASRAKKQIATPAKLLTRQATRSTLAIPLAMESASTCTNTRMWPNGPRMSWRTG